MDETWDYWLVHKNPYDQANENFLKWWKQDVESMIQTDYNHPSVIMYSIGNEISELGTVKGQELCDEIANYVRAFDETRPVTCGVNLLLTGMAQKVKVFILIAIIRMAVRAWILCRLVLFTMYL